MIEPWRRLLCGIGVVLMLTSCADVLTPPPLGEAAMLDRGEIDSTLLDSGLADAVDTGGRGTEEILPPEETDAARIKAQLFPGTGVFINPVPTLFSPAQVNADGDITLNFSDADVREVARAILGDILKLNFVVDANVTGTITVQTSRPLPRDALLPALETALRLNGAALVRNGYFYKIVPLANAARESVRIRAGHSNVPGEGFGIQIVPLRYAAAAEMQKILEPIAAKGSVLRVDGARNLLMLAGTQQQLSALMDAIEIFDVDWLEGMSFGLFTVRYADAAELAQEVRELFGPDADNPLAGLVRVIPITRLNSLLVMSQQQSYVDRAGEWIERLDQSIDQTSQRIFVYYVQYSLAGDLADVLTEIFTGEKPATRGRDSEGEVAPGLEAVEISSNDNTRTAEEASAAREEALAEIRDRRAQLRGGSGNDGDGIAFVGKSDIRIIADEANNALVIMATPGDYRLVEAALRKLDIEPLQVLIEATIAEVTLTDELKYGLQWFFATSNFDFTQSGASDGSISASFPGFSSIFSSGTDVRLVLNALTSITDVHVISSPQIMVLDNQTAILQVGDQVPIATQQSVGTGDSNAPLVNSIQFRDTGVILKVTPRVNANGMVIMEIEQEVSDVALTTSSGIDSPTIQQRKISSTVAIYSGETVVLGGLIRDTESDTRSGIPILAKVPVLGALFGSTTDTFRRTELLVLITPRVIGNQRDARRITEEMRVRMRAVVPLAERIK